MSTFSQLIDDVIQEQKRPDMLSLAASYLNQTIREVHFRADTGSILHFLSNFHELQVTASSESGYAWNIPDPAIFQGLTQVQYADVWDAATDSPAWSRETQPSRTLNTDRPYHYRVGQSFVFSGYGGVNKRINLGFFLYPRRLKYKALAQRLVTYDEYLGYTFAPSITTPEQEAAAMEQETNWLIQRWYDVLAEGLRAKILKRTGDEVRGRTSYSLFNTLRQGLWTAEVADLGGPL